MEESVIVTALDGSPTAESVLPHAMALANCVGARIMLVVVWENVEESLLRPDPEMAAQIAVSGQEACRRYADERAAKIEAAGLKADTRILVGKPAEAVLGLADEFDALAIAIASHGRSGVGRWWYGSVAGAILRHARRPVLVVGPQALPHIPAAEQYGRILVPLDGSEVAEHALDVAARLTTDPGAHLLLAQVLRWSTQAFLFGVPDVDTTRIDEELTKASEEYLQRMKERISADTETRVLHGIPAEELLKLIDKERLDLVVMGTHGRGALMRVALGSVADRMIHGAAPVLLVRDTN